MKSGLVEWSGRPATSHGASSGSAASSSPPLTKQWLQTQVKPNQVLNPYTHTCLHRAMCATRSLRGAVLSICKLLVDSCRISGSPKQRSSVQSLKSIPRMNCVTQRMPMTSAIARDQLKVQSVDTDVSLESCADLYAMHNYCWFLCNLHNYKCNQRQRVMNKYKAVIKASFGELHIYRKKYVSNMNVRAQTQNPPLGVEVI